MTEGRSDGSAACEPSKIHVLPLRRLGAALAGAVCLALFGAAGIASAQPAYTLVAGSPFPTGGTQPFSVAFAPGGTLLAAANYQSNSVSVFSVGATGGLTAVAGSPFPNAGVGAFAVAFSPGGGLLAVANYNSESVSMFSVAPNGALSLVAAPFPTSGVFPDSVAFSPDGGLLAATNRNSSTVSMFTVARDGTLSPVGSPVPTGLYPYSVAFSPDGGLLATANFGDNTVTVFSVARDGTLTQEGAPVPTIGAEPASVAFSPDGGLLATANGDNRSNSVSVFSVARNGGLSLVGSPVRTGRAPYSVAFSPDGGLLATGNLTGNSVSVFSVARNGTLTAEGSPLATVGGAPYSIAFSPTGGQLATANFATASVSNYGATGGFELRQLAFPPVVARGRVLFYRLTLRPNGVAGASGTVTDDLSGVLNKASYRNDARASTGTVAFDTDTRQLVWNGTLAPGAQARISYSVRISLFAFGLLRNAVNGPPGSTCAGFLSPPPPCVNLTPVVGEQGNGPDLVLSTIPSSGIAHPGGQMTFVLPVSNNGPNAATGVTVENPGPAGLFIQAAHTSQGSCTITASNLQCGLGRLPEGGHALVTVTAKVAANASGTLHNQATVYGDEADREPSNNVARSAIIVKPLPSPSPDPGTQPISDLQVSVRDPSAPAGNPTTYTVTVTNAGPDPAMNVRAVVGFRLPVKVLSVHPSQGQCQAGQPLRCSLGTLAVNAQAKITIGETPLLAGAQVVSAAATSASWDPATRSNLAAVSHRVASVLGLSNTASRASAAAGQTVTFTLETANRSRTTLEHVRTCDTLPSGLIYLSATPAATRSVGRYCWTAASLAKGKTQAYKLTVQIPLGAGGAATNTATAAAIAAPVASATATIHITANGPVACPAARRPWPLAHAAC